MVSSHPTNSNPAAEALRPDSALPAVVRRAWASVSEVLDPEVPALTVTDLGIVRDIQPAGEEGVTVTLTPTYTGCPATHAIELAVLTQLTTDGFDPVHIQQRLDPPWTTDWISDSAREKLEAYGIAPPAGSSAKLSLTGEDSPARCPLCKSANVAKVSDFGSTACKAMYRCRDCLEPFEYFKCL